MRTLLLKQTDHKDVIQLSFSNKEFDYLDWEDETEFRYKGEMYDVIEKKAKGDSVILRCIGDKKETSLLQEYQKNTKRNSSNSFLAQLITAQFILPSDFSLQRPQRAIEINFRNYASSLVKSIAMVSSPPPDFC